MDCYDKEFPFKEKNEIAIKFENDRIFEIQKTYPLTHRFEPKEKNRLFECDVVVPEIDKRIEIKFDEKGKETRNICIEIGQDGRESGLKTTLAEYWLHSEGIYLYLALTEDIKRLIHEKYDNELIKLKENPDYVPDLHGIILQKQFPVKQENGWVKYMDWYLIPKNVFRECCLEIGKIGEFEYNKLK